MKKILFVVTEDWYFCSHRLNLAKAAISAGFHVAVATRVQKHGALIQNTGIELIPLKKMKRRGNNPWDEFKSIVELVGIYKQYQPNIVHHVAIKPMLYGSIAAWLVGVQHKVQAISGFGFVFSSDSLKAKLLRIPVRFLLRLVLVGKFTDVIVQNPDDVEMARKLGVSSKHIHLIASSGVDTKAFPNMPEPAGDMIQLVVVARMLWDKGVGEFVEAVRLLKRRGVKFQAILVGEPDDSNPASISLQQLEAWKAEGIIDWQGRRNDIVNVWKSSHIAVLPSYREGFPKSLLEAASCARPMITTDVPGCRFAVKHEETGLLVPVKDAFALADAIERLVNDSALRQRMGREARSVVEKEFADEIVNQLLINLYDKKIRAV